jgi:hypothetical protein
VDDRDVRTDHGAIRPTVAFLGRWWPATVALVVVLAVYER